MRIFSFNSLQISTVVDFSSTHTFEKIKNDIITGINDEFRFFADKDFGIGVDKIYIDILENEKRNWLILWLGVNTNVVLFSLRNESFLSFESKG